MRDKLFGEDDELHWLRKRRNQLVHVRENQNIFNDAELHKIEENFGSMELDAKRAVRIVFKIMYANPGT